MNNYEKVKAWKKRTKERIVQAFGSKCALCGNKYPNEVYDLHHLDPKEKSFGLSNKHGICKSWNKIVVELRKCILVCSNCHRLIHNDLVDVPENVTRFDESFLSYKTTIVADLEVCPVCGKKTKQPYNMTCSITCAAKKRSTIDWDSVDLLALYNEHKNYSKIGRMFGVSDSSIRKRVLRLKSNETL